MGDACDFLVDRKDWTKTRFEHPALPELTDGQVLLGVDRFALTSNNVSYALAGDLLGYWKFFPAGGGFGRVPAMGFGDVLRSRHAEVVEGERVFGFFPMSTHLVIRADGAGPAAFYDASPHRSESAPVYRQYTRTRNDPLYEPDHEDALMLLRGLFLTAFLVDDFLADNALFGARRVVVSSASSKTALALAHRLAARPGCESIGLTSPQHADFAAEAGAWDRVLPYADLETLPCDPASVFVDHAGDAGLLERVHRHFARSLKYCCLVGATHWDSPPRASGLPGPEPTFFFAPAQAQKRAGEWGPTRFQERVAEAWRGFRASTEAWLEVERAAGPAALEAAWRSLVTGRAEPRRGLVLSLREPGRSVGP